MRKAPVLPDPVEVSYRKPKRACGIPTGLGDGDKIHVHRHGRDGVHLDDSGGIILAELDVLKHDWVQSAIGPLCLGQKKNIMSITTRWTHLENGRDTGFTLTFDFVRVEAREKVEVRRESIDGRGRDVCRYRSRRWPAREM